MRVGLMHQHRAEELKSQSTRKEMKSTHLTAPNESSSSAPTKDMRGLALLVSSHSLIICHTTKRDHARPDKHQVRAADRAGSDSKHPTQRNASMQWMRRSTVKLLLVFVSGLNFQRICFRTLSTCKAFSSWSLICSTRTSTQNAVS